MRAVEERLLTPEVRGSREELTKLLADDFLEFGSSDRTFDKQAIIALLEDESALEWSIHDFAVKQLSDDVVMVTYTARAVRPEEIKTSLRSSIWVYRDERWQPTFHQGTKVRLDGRSRTFPDP
ncbi:MAG: DUF4440 domain-containing protein [Acidobacteriota bacterium]|nr:MAG: DUF4440 domain-containing protein [Acidobacteriota bacterium]